MGAGSSSSPKKSGKNEKTNEEEEAKDKAGMELVEIGANRSKNVLILMSDTGGGHRASAESIRDAFQLEFGDEYNVNNQTT